MNLFSLIDEAEKIGMIQHREEISALAAFLAALQPKNVMEIGSWKGGTFRIITAFAKPEGVKISQDIDAYGDIPEGLGPRNEMMKSWTPNVHALLGFSQDIRRIGEIRAVMPDDYFDFVMIDGDHSYDAVQRDWELYFPLVRQGGWLALHDINETQFRHPNAAPCDVPRFWNELKGNPTCANMIEFNVKRDWGGIGLVQKKD